MRIALSLLVVQFVSFGMGPRGHAQTSGPASRQAILPPSRQTSAQGAAPAGAEGSRPAVAQADSQRDSLPQAPSHTLLSRSGSPGVAPHMVNGRPYAKPDEHALVADYLHDTYGVPGFARTTVRALYAEGRGKPTGWSTDAAGFGQRYGSAFAVTAINGTVRYGFENALHEDLRYIPCHGCDKKQKFENVFLSEITARHGDDGHRSFSLTPTIAEMSGPIITHTLWYPGRNAGPTQGAITARTVFVTRIGAHLFEEFIWERRHKDAHGELARNTH